jgi:hypothetical protein
MNTEKQGRLTVTISAAVTKEQANEIYTAMVAGDMTVLGTVLDSSTKEWVDLKIVGDSSQGLATEAPQLSLFIADEDIQMQQRERRTGPPVR